ncbi:MAG: hypothetical protein ABSB88_23135 [Bryobacteraceae bacterium]|jgi:hypothetical protein
MDNGNAKKSTIDERLEALAQSVELMHRHWEDRHQQTAADIAKLTALMAETGRFINRLAHIAEAHENRIDRLEGP